ncbi:MAG: MFS transporter, partial [bacterium]|nr:MFS transporter [bacterium]
PPPGAAARLADLDAGTRVQVRRTMRLSTLEGSLTQVFLNWTSGSVLIGFMLHLGASPAEIALVGSVPLLSQVASPAAAYLAAAFGRRKLLTIVMALVSRLTWLLAAALTLVPMPDPWRPTVLILVVLVSSFFLAANGTLWTAWMGDVVPERERGRYFGLRAGIVGVVAMAANLAAGAFLDRVGAPLSFQAVLVASVVIALIGVVIYALQLDPPPPRTNGSVGANCSHSPGATPASGASCASPSTGSSWSCSRRPSCSPTSSTRWASPSPRWRSGRRSPR